MAEPLTVDLPPAAPEWLSHEIIRIHPRWVKSWHIDPDNPEGGSRSIEDGSASRSR